MSSETLVCQLQRDRLDSAGKEVLGRVDELRREYEARDEKNKVHSHCLPLIPRSRGTSVYQHELDPLALHLLRWSC
jgi:hypothetical protein